MTAVAKLRHLAIATDDPDATAQFYVDSFEFSRVSKVDAAWGFGHVLTDGGRVLCAVGLGESVSAAQTNAYDIAAAIHWPGMQYRRDIGYRAVARERGG